MLYNKISSSYDVYQLVAVLFVGDLFTYGGVLICCAKAILMKFEDIQLWKLLMWRVKTFLLRRLIGWGQSAAIFMDVSDYIIGVRLKSVLQKNVVLPSRSKCNLFFCAKQVRFNTIFVIWSVLSIFLN